MVSNHTADIHRRLHTEAALHIFFPYAHEKLLKTSHRYDSEKTKKKVFMHFQRSKLYKLTYTTLVHEFGFNKKRKKVQIYET